MPSISVIVPTKKVNKYLKKGLIPSLRKQTFKDFELIIVPDFPDSSDQLKPKDTPGPPAGGLPEWRGKAKLPSFVKVIPSGKIGPAKKRDLAAKEAKGDILAFIDDDAHAHKNWLKNAVCYFKKQVKGSHREWPERSFSSEVTRSTKYLEAPRTVERSDDEKKNIAAVCGPGITPPDDNLKQKVSGWVWRSWLGAGGAGTYRCQPEKKREVDDYPAFNLFVRKKDFKAVGGFDSHFWPGEDSKLCHDLVYKLKKKIIYYPKILVYHHRREIFLPHLAQIARFGLHRGHFARILPKTSFRLGYFLPSFFVLAIFLIPILFLILKKTGFANLATLVLSFYLLITGIYSFLLLITALNVYLKEKNLSLSLLLIPAIFLTHLIYGFAFIKGLLTKNLNSRKVRFKISQIVSFIEGKVV